MIEAGVTIRVVDSASELRTAVSEAFAWAAPGDIDLMLSLATLVELAVVAWRATGAEPDDEGGES